MSTRKILGGKGQPARRADNLAAICEPIFYEMWEPQHLTTLWASKACYRDPFTLIHSFIKIYTILSFLSRFINFTSFIITLKSLTISVTEEFDGSESDIEDVSQKYRPEITPVPKFILMEQLY
jgi:hypothetical protein